jgi:methyl-accepting chemotaxis protein
MLFFTALSVRLLVAVAAPDTIIARTMPVRGLFEYASGVLEIIVLLLGIGVLVALVMLLFTLRAGIDKLNGAIERLTSDVRPLMISATDVVADARHVVGRIRTDVERVSDAAGAVADQLLHAAEVTAERVDDVNAVLDVLQAELEDVALSTVAKVRGISVGARLLGAAFGRRKHRGQREAAVTKRRERERERDRDRDRGSAPA